VGRVNATRYVEGACNYTCTLFSFRFYSHTSVFTPRIANLNSTLAVGLTGTQKFMRSRTASTTQHRHKPHSFGDEQLRPMHYTKKSEKKALRLVDDEKNFDVLQSPLILRFAVALGANINIGVILYE